MNKIIWCSKKKEGIRIVEQSTNLSRAYLIKAEEALESMRINKIKDWKISTAYYTIYFSLYSIMAKIGIKCEIHSCTIEFIKRFLKDYFSEEEIIFFEESLKARTDSQYYIDRTVPDELYNKMIIRAPRILVKCKDIVTKLNERKINEVRNSLMDETK